MTNADVTTRAEVWHGPRESTPQGVTANERLLA